MEGGHLAPGGASCTRQGTPHQAGPPAMAWHPALRNHAAHPTPGRASRTRQDILHQAGLLGISSALEVDVQCCAVLCAVLCAMLCCAVLCCVVLCCVVLCCVLCCAVCCAVLVLRELGWVVGLF